MMFVIIKVEIVYLIQSKWSTLDKPPHVLYTIIIKEHFSNRLLDIYAAHSIHANAKGELMGLLIEFNIDDGKQSNNNTEMLKQ